MRKILLLISVLLVIPLQILVAQTPKIIGYQYWFDDNDAGMISESVSPVSTLDLTTSVNVPAFPLGFHRFSIRFKDDSLRYSQISSSLFYYPVSTLINGYEYWYNSDYAGKTAVSVSNTTFLDLSSAISSSALSPGMNTFHIRFRDVTGTYSSISSAYFVIVPEMLISGYEYWFDNDYGSKTAVNVANTQMLDLSSVINANTLLLGFHTFHIRFKNTTGTWCSTQSDLFYKHGTGNQNNLISYEYWFDNNPAGKVTLPLANQPTADLVATMDAATLEPGLHKAHVRFQSGDLPSVVSSGYFYKSGTASIAENAISGYRYWFDNDPATMREITLAQPAANVVLLDSVEPPYLPLGNHLFNVEFRDTLGAFSSIVSDSVNVLTCHPSPAGNITGITQLCKGTNGVVYSIPPISNATGYAWNLPAGATLVSGANTRTITVNYSLNAVNGLITVSGTNPCGSGTGNSLPVNVNSLPAPVITPAGPTTLCPGESLVLTASGGAGYLWSNAATTAAITISATGTYSVTVTNSVGCSNATSREVTAMPVPPSTVILTGNTVPSGQVLCGDAASTLILQGGSSGPFRVQGGGSAILIAGETIQMLSGVVVQPGGYLHGFISANCFYCNAVPHTLPQTLKDEEIAGVPGADTEGSDQNDLFRVYPNPTTGAFTLELTDRKVESGTVEIYGMHGETLLSRQLPGGRKHELSIGDKADGIYIIRVVANGVSGIARIVKY